MIYNAKQLKTYLNNLVLVGQNFDNELEWVGTNEQWKACEMSACCDYPIINGYCSKCKENI